MTGSRQLPMLLPDHIVPRFLRCTPLLQGTSRATSPYLARWSHAQSWTFGSQG